MYVCVYTYRYMYVQAIYPRTPTLTWIGSNRKEVFIEPLDILEKHHHTYTDLILFFSIIFPIFYFHMI